MYLSGKSHQYKFCLALMAQTMFIGMKAEEVFITALFVLGFPSRWLWSQNLNSFSPMEHEKTVEKKPFWFFWLDPAMFKWQMLVECSPLVTWVSFLPCGSAEQQVLYFWFCMFYLTAACTLGSFGCVSVSVCPGFLAGVMLFSSPAPPTPHPP